MCFRASVPRRSIVAVSRQTDRRSSSIPENYDSQEWTGFVTLERPSWIGTSRATVARMLNQLRRDGVMQAVLASALSPSGRSRSSTSRASTSGRAGGL